MRKFILFIALISLIGKLNGQETKTIETVLPFTDKFTTIEVEEKNGQYIFNGDIIVQEVKKPEYYDQLFKENEDVLVQSTATANVNSLWKNGELPYVISSSMPSNKRQEILEAIETLNKETKINIVPRSYQRDYVLLRYNGDGGCNSYIGRIGGRQIINVAEWCGTGSIMHEFLHAMGFYHEHNRADRDSYIKINWSNISAGWRSQYQKVNNRNAKSFGPYDFESIMHYPRGNGNFDCYNQNDCDKVGNRTYLSKLDINGINKLYYFSTKKNPVIKKPKIENKVPVFFKTVLADDQIFENVIVKIGNDNINFSVSFRDKEDQGSFKLVEGKEYTYEVYVDCTEFDKIDGKYYATKRVGKGKGKFTATRNKELNLYSNRSTTSGNYTVELK